MHPGYGRTDLDSHEHIILAGEEEVLAGRVNIVLLDEREVVARCLPFVIFLFVEAVRELDVVFPLAVLHAVSQVAAGKPLGVEVGSRHAADPHAEALEFVRAERRIHRTEVELARLAVFPRRDVSGDKNLGRFDDDVEDGNLPHLREQIIKGAFLLAERDMAVLHPEGIGTSHSTLRHMDFAQEIEDGIALGNLEFVFIVVSQVVGIELLRSLNDVEVDVGVLGIKHPGAIRHLLELLVDAELIDEVQVDVGRRIEGKFLQRIASVEHHVEATGKPIALAIDRHECQIDALVPGHVHRVHDVIFIIGSGQRRGKRADEAVQQYLNVVVEDVDALEYLVEVGADAPFVERLIDTLLAAGDGDELLRFRLLAVIFIDDGFADREGKDRFPVEFRRVEVVLDEVELAREVVLLEIGTEIVEREGELLVHLYLILVFRLDTVLVFMLDDFFDEFHGRIVPPAVAFASGLDHDLADFDGSRGEEDFQPFVLPRFQGNGFLVIAQRGDDHLADALRVLQRELSEVVGHRADSGVLENHGNVG